MNFFEHQDRARRKTTHLVALLALAVATLIAITTLGAAALIYFSGNAPAPAYDSSSVWQGILRALNWQSFTVIALTVASVVLLGSAFRFFQLTSGGRAIAEAMGGRLLLGQTQDADERKILNIVEEMAMASGTPVPPVYLLEDDAINAFTAGYYPQDAVIGITRGCIAQLSRDELQGVVAHEFSHIFHGDMRLNMRLIALLYGILVIGLIGEFLLRSNRSARLLRSSRDRSQGAIVLIGLGLLIIGYTGTFFGNLIKAAVSRQREFLADASAVQFTRNPEGIAGALKKIAASSQGSTLHTEQAAEFSHMYFSQGVQFFLSMMATHPPLTERIKRILPRWKGELNEPARSSSHTNQQTSHFSAHLSATNNAGATSLPTESHQLGELNLEQALTQIAQPNAAQLSYARQCLAQIAPELRAASEEGYSARAIVLGLALDPEPPKRQQQLTLLQKLLSASDWHNLKPIVNLAAASPATLRLPLLEISLAPLKQLSASQQKSFLAVLEQIIRADHKTSLMEWCLQRIVQQHLAPQPVSLRKYSLQDLQSECVMLLSFLAYSGARQRTAAESAFAQSCAALNLNGITLLPIPELQVTALDHAIARLNQLKPLQKPRLLKAMSLCVMQDGKLRVQEAELFRALADSLDCPIPPQLAAQPISNH